MKRDYLKHLDFTTKNIYMKKLLNIIMLLSINCYSQTHDQVAGGSSGKLTYKIYESKGELSIYFNIQLPKKAFTRAWHDLYPDIIKRSIYNADEKCWLVKLTDRLLSRKLQGYITDVMANTSTR